MYHNEAMVNKTAWYWQTNRTNGLVSMNKWNRKGKKHRNIHRANQNPTYVTVNGISNKTNEAKVRAAKKWVRDAGWHLGWVRYPPSDSLAVREQTGTISLGPL